MASGLHTTALVAALYVSDYDTAGLARLRVRARTDLAGLVADLTALVLTVTPAHRSTVHAGRFDAARLADCEHVAVTVLAALALVELGVVLGLPAG